MQDRYVGDVGDFGKYGLLRTLCRADAGGEELSLGVVWYLVPDEGHNDDGKHVRYLSSGREATYRLCEPELYDGLRRLIRDGARSVREIRRRDVLPSGTTYHEAALSFAEVPFAQRRALREQWVRAATQAVDGSEIVFVDPDNGLETEKRREAKTGPKHVYYDEIEPYVSRGQSVVVYHHLGRYRGGHEQEIRDRLRALVANLALPEPPFAVRYRRGTSRAFFILPASRHAAVLKRRVESLLSGPWATLGHFDPGLLVA